MRGEGHMYEKILLCYHVNAIRMAAPECLPLILEPESKFYADPVLVLDFQSLYPSMVIAYNYCFSTCLGRVHHLSSSVKQH